MTARNNESGEIVNRTFNTLSTEQNSKGKMQQLYTLIQQTRSINDHAKSAVKCYLRHQQTRSKDNHQQHRRWTGQHPPRPHPRPPTPPTYAVTLNK